MQALQNFTKSGQSFAQIFLIEEDEQSGEVEEWENSSTLVWNIEQERQKAPGQKAEAGTCCRRHKSFGD